MYSPSFRLDGKLAVVSGAGRGIGRAIALGMAEAGADVVLMARSKQELENVAETIRGMGHKAYPICADFSNKKDIEEAFKEVSTSVGKLDILVNNAGMNIRIPAIDVGEDEWEKLVNLNMKGAFFSSQEAAKVMIGKGGGRIISIASIAGLVACRSGIVYSMTKAAVIQMTKTLALEMGKHGINVNAIAPWYVKTSMTEKVLKDEKLVSEIMSRTIIKRLEFPEDLVGTAIFLATDASNYITGQTIFVDGGMTVYGF